MQTLVIRKTRVAAILDRAAHPPLALALVILPRVVEEVDAGVDRFVNDPDGLGDRLRLAEVIAAEADDGHQVGVPPEGRRSIWCARAWVTSVFNGLSDNQP